MRPAPTLTPSARLPDLPGPAVRCGGALVRRLNLRSVRVTWTDPPAGHEEIFAPAGWGLTLGDVFRIAREREAL